MTGKKICFILIACITLHAAQSMQRKTAPLIVTDNHIQDMEQALVEVQRVSDALCLLKRYMLIINNPHALVPADYYKLSKLLEMYPTTELFAAYFIRLKCDTMLKRMLYDVRHSFVGDVGQKLKATLQTIEKHADEMLPKAYLFHEQMHRALANITRKLSMQ